MCNAAWQVQVIECCQQQTTNGCYWLAMLPDSEACMLLLLSHHALCIVRLVPHQMLAHQAAGAQTWLQYWRQSVPQVVKKRRFLNECHGSEKLCWQSLHTAGLLSWRVKLGHSYELLSDLVL
jgi:hypothetical protein